MWVSTGIAGMPREKHKITAAVFGPMPSNFFSQVLASSRGISERKDRSKDPTSSRIWFKTILMRRAFILNRPAVRIVFSRVSMSELAIASIDPNDCIRLSKARPEFMSEVCWDRIV